ncbi:MAG: GxxExxY protein [Candidatus Hydrogenedentes bacterium]|nr:GxxExxY protein [Candidatus Hydrogenedentota bacterium]
MKEINHGDTGSTGNTKKLLLDSPNLVEITPVEVRELVEPSEELIDKVLTVATDVHRELGPGLYENVYEAAMMIELSIRGLKSSSQVPISVNYKGHDLGLGFRADLIVEDQLLLELKAVEELNDQHLAQVICYLKLLGFKRGYLLNFCAKLMKDGIKRISI